LKKNRFENEGDFSAVSQENLFGGRYCPVIHTS